MESIIRTEKLSKNFGKVKAVDEVSIHVKKGEIYGFLGLNGAGKSTTIRMLLGMIRPSSGAAYVYGKKMNPDRTDLFAVIGYMVETPHAYPDLTVRENLEIARRLRFMKDDGSVLGIMKQLNLVQYKDRKAKDLSSGNSQRLGLAKAMVHNPDILILDEPANGLDPSGIVEIRELLLDLSSNKGVTIFISSHILGEIAKIATRIGIIHEGKLVHEVDSQMLDAARMRRLIVNAVNTEKAKASIEREGIEVGRTDEGKLVIRDAQVVAHPEKIASMLTQSGNPPTLLFTDEEDLESYFLRMIGRQDLK
jgi:ABC-2 type transport system ATP-binding protein